MNAKIEREKIIDFKYESQMKDVGVFQKRFKIKRRRPQLDAAFITTKAALTGGITPLTRGEMLLIDTLATLNVYFEPVDHMGNPTNEDGWVDNIFDQDILFALHKEWADYQNSFYPEAQGVKDGNTEKAEPAATSQAPVQG